MLRWSRYQKLINFTIKHVNSLHIVQGTEKCAPPVNACTGCLRWRNMSSFCIVRGNGSWTTHRYYHLSRLLLEETSNKGVSNPLSKASIKANGTKSEVKEPDKDSIKQPDKDPIKELVKEASKSPDVFPPPSQQTIVKVVPKRPRRIIDYSKSYTDNNFTTSIRAMNEYLLKPSDLEGLRKTQRRSPFDGSPPITVFLRKDVEEKAYEVWGSPEALQRELKKRREEEQKHRENIFQVKKAIKEYNKLYGSRPDEPSFEKDAREGFSKGSGRVVLTAVVINATNFAFKTIAWAYTGSHSMFSEAIHSLADTCNQLILAFGIHYSVKKPDYDHPYGYSNIRYVASLISGVGIFCFGTGLAWYHGITALLHPSQVESLYWAFFVLAGSLISEGATLIIALNEINRSAKKIQMSVMEYILRGQDPSVNVVLLEDLAAVIGVSIAATCMGITALTDSYIPDAIGSLLIGGLLGIVASFIIYSNSAALVGRSIPVERQIQLTKELESDVMIRAVHDVKATDMGGKTVRYKAEVDFDGREITRTYLDRQDLDAMLFELQGLKTIDEVEIFMLKHGENIIDLVGAEIDRIETTLKKRHPEVRHVDLEVL